MPDWSRLRAGPSDPRNPPVSPNPLPALAAAPSPPFPFPRPPPQFPPPSGGPGRLGLVPGLLGRSGRPPGWARAPRPELVLAAHGTPGRAAAALGGGLQKGEGSWEGPLSLAVFGEPRGGLQELLGVLAGPCRALRGRLRLQVVQGAARPPPRIPAAPPPQPWRGGCRGALARLAAADPPSYALGAPYPGNLLRNVAWQGAAGGGPGPRPPPQFWQRFVLVVDADVEPSPGLREGFLELLRGGGLDPQNWGRDPQNWGRDPRNWGREPQNWGGQEPKSWGGQGDPKAPGSWGVLRTQGDLGNPKTLNIQGSLGFQGDFGNPKILGASGGLGVSNTSGVPNGLSDPNIQSDPNAQNDTNTWSDHNALSDPKTLSDPNALNAPKTLSDPKTWSDHNDPSDPKALSDPKAQNDPKALSAPHAPHDPSAQSDPSAPNTPSAPHAPGAPQAPAGAPPWARTLFVLPAFELRGSGPRPGSKAELLQLWGAGEARPFYGALCPRCQAPTAFGRWRALPPGPPGAPRLRVAYEAPWRDPWEPFYVAPAHGVPPFDEGFLQYGFNRISQACELHVAGFRFAVLDGAWVTHRGWKEPGGFHAGREAELGRNRQRFREFKRGLKLKYPDSERRC
ncbi:beta-1,4-glucuronyltransferase 1 [Melospiza melodia melodia]|uniref:beta-1,4-glucuronyltransferase 1 n=1 Tax=Melospiza melodia melodia TaxID=1914991 RepID=UPI002FD234C1